MTLMKNKTVPLVRVLFGSSSRPIGGMKRLICRFYLLRYPFAYFSLTAFKGGISLRNKIEQYVVVGGSLPGWLTLWARRDLPGMVCGRVYVVTVPHASTKSPAGSPKYVSQN